MQQNRLPGFTLIELLVYSFIVSFIVGAFLITSYYLISSSQRDRERHAVIENERFVAQKLAQLLYGVNANKIWLWPSSSSGSVLYFQRPNGDYYAVHPLNNEIRIASAYDTNGNGEPDAFFVGRKWTNNHVTATGLLFNRQTINDQSAIRATANLQGKYTNHALDKTFYIK